MVHEEHVESSFHIALFAYACAAGAKILLIIIHPTPIKSNTRLSYVTVLNFLAVYFISSLGQLKNPFKKAAVLQIIKPLTII